MLLADSVILIVGGLILVGIIGFFAMSVALVVRFLGFVFRTLTGASNPRLPARQPGRELSADQRHDTCPHPRCGHVNRYGSRFCARCGRALSGRGKVDAYG
ncbi:MAG: zinc ribbon domain-containing protein [Planctomycetota bacterium]